MADDPTRARFELSGDVDVFRARTHARAMARCVGFSKVAQAEIAVVVSELAWNVVKHAGGGVIELSIEGDASGPEMVITTIDDGPDLGDLEAVVRDGFTASGALAPDAYHGRAGIGAGLGAVKRWSDDLSYDRPGGCNRITARRRPARISRPQ